MRAGIVPRGLKHLEFSFLSKYTFNSEVSRRNSFRWQFKVSWVGVDFPNFTISRSCHGFIYQREYKAKYDGLRVIIGSAQSEAEYWDYNTPN